MGGRLNLDGGTLNLDGGTLTLDGGTRPPYNLNTGFIAAKYVYCAVYYVQCLLNCSLGQHSNKIQLTNIFNVLVMSDAGLDDICKQRWT